VNVTGAAAGVKNNTTAQVTSSNGGTGATASASIAVVAAPSITKSFGAETVPVGGSTSLTFTLSNPSANPVALTGVAFTDALPAGLVVATPSGVTNTCGAIVTATPGTAVVSLSGATIAREASCTLTVNVTALTIGAKVNTTGQVTSTNGGAGTTASASLTVLGSPTISKAFGAATLSVGDTTTLTFTLANPNTTMALTGVGFTDALPTGVVVAAPNGLSGSCGGGAITASPGAQTVSLVGATLAAAASCTFSVNVTAKTAGTKVNQVQAFADGTGRGSRGTAILTVGRPDLAIASHHDGTFHRGIPAAYSVVVSNVGAGASTEQVTVKDYLPAGMILDPVGGAGWSCSVSIIVVTCTRTDRLDPGASYPPIVISVTPTFLSSSNSMNIAQVTIAGDPNNVNNVSVDATVVQ
jgi:uncharacterized repeat protein (TIGR01451 family)